ncbi:MAG TPA: glycosyltransferase, partial [Candidatus Nanoarchaeia archaeon]|nr:glycosyltransferase [Candidatus Nanoarchaeia archaeon]
MDILYITYDGLLDPLGQSQIIPYLVALAKEFRFHVVSFEKSSRTMTEVAKLRAQLSTHGISWYPLRYHKRLSVLATLYDVIQGIRVARKIISRTQIKIVHARSYVAALIALPVRYGKKFLFDMRGFWPEERVEGGLWRKESLVFHLAKYFERRFFHAADAVIVLTRAAQAILKQQYHIRIPIWVIPTCVDTMHFSPRPKDRSLIRQFHLEKKFVLAYSGSLGTWYRSSELIDFFQVLCAQSPAHLLLIVNDLLKAKML